MQPFGPRAILLGFLAFFSLFFLSSRSPVLAQSFPTAPQCKAPSNTVGIGAGVAANLDAANADVCDLLNANVRAIRVVNKGNLEQNIGKSDAAGIKPIIVLLADSLTGVCVPSDGPNSQKVKLTQEYIDAFAAMAKKAAQTYGKYHPAFEIWNEEDQASEAAYGLEAKEYAVLLAAAYKAIKEVDPKIQVIVGGLVGGNSPGYLDTVISTLGGARPFDGIGYHPYSTTADG